MNETRREITQKIVLESLVWIGMLAAGSWVIFGDDVGTVAATILGGFPGAYFLIASKELIDPKGKGMKYRTKSKLPRGCARNMAIILVIYDVIMLYIMYLVNDHIITIVGMLIFLVVQLFMIAIVLSTEYLATKVWPAPTLQFLCDLYGQKPNA